MLFQTILENTSGERMLVYFFSSVYLYIEQLSIILVKHDKNDMKKR